MAVSLLMARDVQYYSQQTINQKWVTQLRIDQFDQDLSNSSEATEIIMGGCHGLVKDLCVATLSQRPPQGPMCLASNSCTSPVLFLFFLPPVHLLS